MHAQGGGGFDFAEAQFLAPGVEQRLVVGTEARGVHSINAHFAESERFISLAIVDYLVNFRYFCLCVESPSYANDQGY